MVSAALRQLESQYGVKRDEQTGTWTIIDFWHNAMEGLDPDSDLPPDHPALKVLKEGEFWAVLREATRLGVANHLLETLTVPVEEHEELQQRYNAITEELNNLIKNINNNSNVSVGNSNPILREEKTVASEAFTLAEQKLQTIIKLANVKQLTLEIASEILRVGGNIELSP